MHPFAPGPLDLFLLEILLKGSLLLLSAFLLAFALRRASAAVRYGVWSLAFLGLLLLPVGVALLPSWPVTLPAFGPAGALTGMRAPAVIDTPVALPVGPEGTSAAYETAVLRGGAPEARAQGAAGAPWAWSWGQVLLLAWGAGALALLIRLGLVLARLARVRRRAEAVTDPAWTDLAAVLTDVLGITRPVRLLRHEEVVVPMTYGVRRPVVLLPAQADGWPEEQKHVTLLHELLHVRRFDHLVHVLALVARALHWFNPMAWYAAKRLLVERERACDDGVLSMGVTSTSYADHLLGMARLILTGRKASAGALAMARPSELRSRILAILDAGQRRHALTRLRALGMTGCALALVVPLAAMQPDGSSHVRVNPVAFDVFGQTTISGTFPRPARAPAEPRPGVDAQPAPAPEAAPQAEGPPAAGPAAPSPSLAPAPPAEERAAPLQRADTSNTEMQKKAVYAISQLPKEQSIPLLIDIARTHRKPEIRAEAVFWLGQEGDSQVADVLESLAGEDARPEVQKKAVFALSELPDGAGLSRLVNIARTHQHLQMRAEAVFWLGQEGGAEVADVLEDFARNDASPEVQRKALFALSELPNEVSVPRLIDLARTHPDPKMQSEAVFWLGETDDPRAADLLMEIIQE